MFYYSIYTNSFRENIIWNNLLNIFSNKKNNDVIVSPN